jgi:malate dehydrogenase (oxaloacetate-decarboxylating)
VARQAQADGVAQPCDQETLNARIRALVWEPVYRPYRRKRFAFKPATQRDDD